MPTKGVSMRKIKSVLRLHYECQLSQHQIAKSLNLSVGVINKYLKRAACAKLSWPLPQELDNEEALRKKLSPGMVSIPVNFLANGIDFVCIHHELKRKGVTIQLLWEEYAQNDLQPLSYSHFCLLYRQWRKTQPQSMRHCHKAGDKVFVDYAGQTVDIIDSDSGEIRSTQIFVGILGASNYTFAEATWSQKLPDWISSHRRMLEFFGGVPALIVPDNLKSGIQKACRYEPDTNPTYADFIDYYGTAVLPARPRKPKDKAKVENAVLVVERWILARLRHRTFVGLTELNAAIRELLYQLNHRPFKKMPGCRASVFDECDKPALRPLPKHPYELTEVKRARVHIDYHVELHHHYYSVPYQYIGKEVMLRFTPQRLECSYQGTIIALHSRSYQKGQHTTLPDHMPKSHRKHMEWTPGRFLSWGAQIGPVTTCYVQHLLESKPHPEQGYRSCLGLLNLARRYGEARLEKACERAWLLGARTRKSVASILEHSMENQPLPEQSVNPSPPIMHDNLRGKQYYH
jgi:transposase